MTTVHDDLPHPVPPIAYLRWKENWFFIIMDVEHHVHGIAHCNYEPGHDRARFSCHLSVQGRAIKYANETRFPDEFALSHQIGDEHLRVQIAGADRFDLALTTDEVDLRVVFEKALPTFDFVACRSTNPSAPSFQEVMTLGTNLPYNHQQQAMAIHGSLEVKAGAGAGERRIAGLGYRDHSWCVRTDNIVASHTWSGLHFGTRAFGVKKLRTLARPDVWAREGYVSDADGERVLRDIEVVYEGKSDGGLPKLVRFDVADIFGKRFTVRCDVAGRHAQVPLVAEKPGKGGIAYQITENFCPAVLEETGETGCALVEIGSAPA
jgi:hypothetical protein